MQKCARGCIRRVTSNMVFAISWHIYILGGYMSIKFHSVQISFAKFKYIQKENSAK